MVCFGAFGSPYSFPRCLLNHSFIQAHYYIAFSILSTALEDPTFGLKGIHIANILLDYFYLGLLIMCFILALGNRPQGSKWPYTLAIIGFGFITIYMTVSALVLAFKGLDQLVKDNKGSLTSGDFFSNPIFRNIVLSLAATLRLYVFASLIFVSRKRKTLP
jgi:chitin synthase